MEKQKFGKYLALDTNIHAQDINLQLVSYMPYIENIRYHSMTHSVKILLR